MQFLTTLLGGKQYVVWIFGFVASIFGKLPMEVFQTLTMAYMVTQAMESGIVKPLGHQSNGFWKIMGGRKFSAWAAVSALLLFRGYPAEAWLEVSAAYVGSVALEKAVFATTNGLQKWTAAKLASALPSGEGANG